jgi:hypothetical protein
MKAVLLLVFLTACSRSSNITPEETIAFEGLNARAQLLEARCAAITSDKRVFNCLNEAAVLGATNELLMSRVRIRTGFQTPIMHDGFWIAQVSSVSR